jgi:hypothetical protein
MFAGIITPSEISDATILRATHHVRANVCCAKVRDHNLSSLWDHTSHIFRGLVLHTCRHKRVIIFAQKDPDNRSVVCDRAYLGLLPEARRPEQGRSDGREQRDQPCLNPHVWRAFFAALVPAQSSFQLPSSEPGPAPSSPSRSARKARLNWIGCRYSAWAEPTLFRCEREPARSPLPHCWRSTRGVGRFEEIGKVLAGFQKYLYQEAA